MDLTIHPKTLQLIKKEGKKLYPNEEYGVIMFDPTCCGGLIHIEIKTIRELQMLSDVKEIFNQDYKEYGVKIYADIMLIPDFPERIEIEIKSEDPVEFTFENADFRN